MRRGPGDGALLRVLLWQWFAPTAPDRNLVAASPVANFISQFEFPKTRRKFFDIVGVVDHDTVAFAPKLFLRPVRVAQSRAMIAAITPKV